MKTHSTTSIHVKFKLNNLVALINWHKANEHLFAQSQQWKNRNYV